MGERRNAYRILVGNPEGKRPLRRPRRRWVDNIKMDVREIGWDSVDWIDLAQDRDQWRALVNAVLAAQLATSQEGISSMNDLETAHIRDFKTHQWITSNRLRITDVGHIKRAQIVGAIQI
jgi:hypothetical protein